MKNRSISYFDNLYVLVMSIVGKLASKDENSKTLAEALDTDCYQKLIETLYLPDISVSI